MCVFPFILEINFSRQHKNIRNILVCVIWYLHFNIRKCKHSQVYSFLNSLYIQFWIILVFKGEIFRLVISTTAVLSLSCHEETNLSCAMSNSTVYSWRFLSDGVTVLSYRNACSATEVLVVASSFRENLNSAGEGIRQLWVGLFYGVEQ